MMIHLQPSQGLTATAILDSLIVNADVAAAAAIAATKIHDGSVDNTEFGHLNGVTSAIQTQLDAKATASSTTTFTNKTFDANGSGNSITNIENADLANSTLQAGKISYFKSTEQTGNGSEQDVAHGLGRTPSLVLVIPSEATGGTDDYAEGTHDGTNVKVTATSGAKYKVLAL